jgi:hypothetical protein
MDFGGELENFMGKWEEGWPSLLWIRSFCFGIGVHDLAIMQEYILGS